MTSQVTPADPQAAGATLHLGGDAYCTPDLAPLLVPADRVSLYPGNARRHDQERITSSLRDLGCWRAAVAQTSTGHVLVGNGQHAGLLELGATQVPVTWRDCPDNLARQIVVRDNRVGDLAHDDPTELNLLLQMLAEDGADLNAMGFSDADQLVLLRQVEATDVFTTGTDHMMDEFRNITDDTGASEYNPGYVAKVTVHFRTDAAIESFRQALGFDQPISKLPANSDRGWALAVWKRYPRLGGSSE